MTRAVLIVRDQEGEPRPTVRSIFPAHKTDLQASTFRSREEAERFAAIMRRLGCASPAMEVLTRWGRP